MGREEVRREWKKKRAWKKRSKIGSSERNLNCKLKEIV